MPGKPEQVAVLNILIHSNPRLTLMSMEADICHFLEELSNFYKTRDKDTADIYRIGLMLHTTIGLALAIKNPKMLAEISLFMKEKSDEYIQQVKNDAIDLLNELLEKENKR